LDKHFAGTLVSNFAQGFGTNPLDVLFCFRIVRVEVIELLNQCFAALFVSDTPQGLGATPSNLHCRAGIVELPDEKIEKGRSFIALLVQLRGDSHENIQIASPCSV
jgi:hypothetical protein